MDIKEIESMINVLTESAEKIEGLKELFDNLEAGLTEIQSEKEDYERQIKDLIEQIEQVEKKDELDPKKAQLEIIEVIREILDRTSYDVALRQKFERLIEIMKNNRDPMDHIKISILLSDFI
ncbi:MAG: hypothetical protein QMD65_03050 [Patescibacteria group bacterium]|nr:hypothetical protein [Patescibacteria group bacterium]